MGLGDHFQGSEMSNIMFVRLNLQYWERVELEGVNCLTPPASLAKPKTGSIGFLEVFGSAEDAEKVYGPDVKLAAIQFEEKK